jgi:HSP20 family protein
MTVVWYDPFRELDRFHRAGAAWMPMDAVRHGDAVDLRFDLPGVAPDTIDVDIERNVLTVKAERHWAPSDGDQVLARERTQGAFTRQVLLGDALDADRLEATYEHGVLTVHVPVAEQAKPRKVQIHVGTPQAQAEALDVAGA